MSSSLRAQGKSMQIIVDGKPFLILGGELGNSSAACAEDPDGTFSYIRRLNGDQDHQGRHARISVGDYKVLHVKLYEYR